MRCPVLTEWSDSPSACSSDAGDIIHSMTTVVEIIIPDSERRVEGQHGSVREGEALADLVADMIAEDGVPSPEAYSWADAVLKLNRSDSADVE